MTTNAPTHTEPTIGVTILNQIGTLNLMRCGAHQFVLTASGVTFKAGGRQRYVDITLDADDTYTVTVFRITALATLNRKVEYSQSGIYCDSLGEIVGREGDRA